jgi:hypothetical protein
VSKHRKVPSLRLSHHDCRVTVSPTLPTTFSRGTTMNTPRKAFTSNRQTTNKIPADVSTKKKKKTAAILKTTI